MAKLISGIHHVALHCPDGATLRRAVDFYTQVLGLSVKFTWEKNGNPGAMIDTGAGYLELSVGESCAADGRYPHVALCTDNVDACAAAVTAAGYEVFLAPKDIAFASVPPRPARIAFCHGPVGEEIEFFTER